MKTKTKALKKVEVTREETTGGQLVEDIETLLDNCFSNGYPQTVQFETKYGKFMVICVKVQE